MQHALAQLVNEGRNVDASDETVAEAMVAALHKYINKHRTGRRPAADQPANGAGRAQGRESVAVGPTRGQGKPATAAKPAAAAGAEQQAGPRPGRKRKKERGEGGAPSDSGTKRTASQRKALAKQSSRVVDKNSPPSEFDLDSDGGEAETEDEVPAAKRAKGRKKPKPRSKNSAADISSVALGDGGSAALDREPSGAGASELY